MYFVQEHSFSAFFHGGVGNADIEKVLLQENFRPILFPHHFSFSVWAKYGRFWFLIKTFFSLKKGSVVLVQFPLYAKMNKMLLRLLHFRRSILTVCLIADINGLKDGNNELLQNEIKELKRAQYFIAHNQSMKSWLLKHIPFAKCSLLYFFDFMTTGNNVPKKKSFEIVFAGNLAKSLFLEDLGNIITESLKFLVYGPGVTKKMKSQKNFFYKGVFPPYGLPQKIEGSFGLVWDGDCIDDPCGSIGHYMQYITHHKVSLYILTGIPVIIYENAGSASLIRKHKIGFTISGLNEIEQKINSISEAEYQQMVNNMKPLAGKISKGEFLKEAIADICLQLP
ncbi:MAG: hypothetical protein JST47_07040 [Bacteroidetes bacterium]|nr:hypothetical protein [Bacteroidota bacterium]